MLTVDLLSNEQLVNDLVTRSQHSPHIDSNGDRTVVAFAGKGPVDRDGIFSKIYGADGTQLTDAFRVNSTIRGEQHQPSVAVQPDGRFVVTWSGRGPGDKQGVFFQQFDADGNRIGVETLVNQTTGGIQSNPVVATLGENQFAISWQGSGDGDHDGIFIRTFSADGASASSEMLVNSATQGLQAHPAIASDGGASFVLTWSSRHEDGSDWGVYGQRFNDSEPVGAVFDVNSTTSFSQVHSSVDMTPVGEFTVTWDSRDQDGDSWGIYAQRFAANGDPVGNEFRVNEQSEGHQRDSAITVDASNNAAVSWSHGVPNGSGWEVHAVSLNAQGELVGEETLVNKSTFGANSGHQALSSMTVSRSGVLAITYSGEGEDDHGGVFFQTVASGVKLNVGPVDDQRVDELETVTLTVPFTTSDDNSSFSDICT